jgi:hypothetical protein
MVFMGIIILTTKNAKVHPERAQSGLCSKIEK